MNKAYIYKRTFEAEKHPKGSIMRKTLNSNTVTSEYMHSYKYILRYLDAVHHERNFRTKTEAIKYATDILKTEWVY